MKLDTFRYHNSNEDTLSLLFIEGVYGCLVVEDQPQSFKVPGETRIPAGIYQLKLRTFGRNHESYKLRFPDIHKGMIELVDVPGFKDILMHIGQTDLDTAGCLCVGNDLRFNPKGRSKLEGSTIAYTRIYPIIANGIIAGPSSIGVHDSIPGLS